MQLGGLIKIQLGINSYLHRLPQNVEVTNLLTILYIKHIMTSSLAKLTYDLAFAFDSGRLLQQAVSLDSEILEKAHTNGFTPLAVAIILEKTTILETLISKLDVNMEDVFADDDNSHSILFAAATGSINAAKKLIELGTPIDIDDGHGNTPLIAAAFNGFTEICDLLLQHGAEINYQHDFQPTHYKTPLSEAVSGGNLETAIFLIEHGAEINILSETGRYYTSHQAETLKKQKTLLEIEKKYGFIEGLSYAEKDKYLSEEAHKTEEIAYIDIASDSVLHEPISLDTYELTT